MTSVSPALCAGPAPRPDTRRPGARPLPAAARGRAAEHLPRRGIPLHPPRGVRARASVHHPHGNVHPQTGLPRRHPSTQPRHTGPPEPAGDRLPAADVPDRAVAGLRSCPGPPARRRGPRRHRPRPPARIRHRPPDLRISGLMSSGRTARYDAGAGSGRFCSTSVGPDASPRSQCLGSDGTGKRTSLAGVTRGRG